jgi:hypothetical protein
MALQNACITAGRKFLMVVKLLYVIRNHVEKVQEIEQNESIL